jgi:hypothetical protein
MSNIEHIESVIRNLSPEELREFRAWYAVFEAEAWDEALRQEKVSPALDALADEALADFAARGTYKYKLLNENQVAGARCQN